MTAKGKVPAIVKIRMKGSDVVYSKREDITKPMSWQELIDKFRDCALHGRKHLTNQKVESVIQLVSGLEEVDDVSEIIQLLG